MKLPKFVILFLLLFLFVPQVNAADPIPGARIPCDQEGNPNPNFHSLRPYQASPCGDSPKAYYCANAVIIYEGGSIGREKQEGIYPADKWIDPKIYAITISETELPFYGNTEQVKNSQNGNDQFDDATKLNEYVSWYLSGVNGHAEYGDVSNDQIINFSGPVKKLLPSVIQEAERLKIIESASKLVTFTSEDSEPGKDEISLTTLENHNQVVVCESGGQAVPCPDGTELKLKDWGEGDLSIFNKILNWIPGIDIWDKKYPPLPWQFDEDIGYQKAYNEWQGKHCVILPIIGLQCFDVPGLASNKWADLYQYIPLTNNSDKNAKMPIHGVQIEGKGGTEISFEGEENSEDKDSIRYRILQEPVNMFAHTQEDNDNLDLLSKTYVPTDCKDGICKPLEGGIDYNTVESERLDNDHCRIVDIRSNEGDDLFTELPPSEIRVEVAGYTITQKVCDKPITKNCPTKSPPSCNPNVIVAWGCHWNVEISITNDSKHPYANEIWGSSVANTTSVFRKIFPKVGENSPVSCIAEIPGVSKAVYTPTEGTKEIVVIGPEGQGRYPPDDAKLFFPHIGGVYEYFLKGIQTALRPKGYGDQVPNGNFCEPVEETKCKEDVPDSAVDSKFLGQFKTNFIDLANRWSAKCPGEENNMAKQCYNYVASEAKKAGVNPAFALTIWLNESGASNYCEGGETTQDFGINLPDLYQDIVGELKAFLNMAKMKLCDGTSGFTEPMHGWLSRFQSSAGACNPADSVASDYYYSVMNETWSYLTSCANSGKFGITWPTDMSCP